MKILVTGSRDWTDHHLIRSALRGLPADTVVIEGAARGADFIAHSVAEEFGYGRIRFPAQWSKNAKRAGPIRNSLMLWLSKPDVCLAFPLSTGSGTRDMMMKCRRAGVRVVQPALGETLD